MNKSFLLLFLKKEALASFVLAIFLYSSAFAQVMQIIPPSPDLQLPAIPIPFSPAAPTGAPWEPRGTAELIALDKVDDRVATLSVPVGQSTTFYALTITVKGCVVRPADLPADAAAYVDIADTHKAQPVFRGWILENEPAASMLQHPIYDIRVAGCH